MVGFDAKAQGEHTDTDTDADSRTHGVQTDRSTSRGAKQKIPAGYRTAAELGKAYNLSPRLLRMALVTLRPPHQSFGTIRYKYYSPAEQARLRTWVEQGEHILYGSIEDGTSMDFFGRVQMIGLDGQLRTYVPQATVTQNLPSGGVDAVIFACTTYWTRVMIEWLAAQSIAGAVVDYQPRPHELACVRFNAKNHHLTWVQEDSIPAFLAWVAKPKRGWQRGTPRPKGRLTTQA